MRKGTGRERDRELIARLQKEAPEVLSAKVDFDALVENILSADPADSLDVTSTRGKQPGHRKPKPAKSAKPS
jgi:hypothetical protein